MLVEFLQDSEEGVRLQAIQTLAQRKERRALPSQQAIVANRSNRMPAEAACAAIIQITSCPPQSPHPPEEKLVIPSREQVGWKAKHHGQEDDPHPKDGI
ncbi:MAG: HEAT repeat domain-containing protein [Anaerolineales bacterium]